MNDDGRQTLKRELRQAGASAPEIAELLPIAAKLKLLAQTRVPTAASSQPLRQRVLPAKYVVVGVIILSVLLAVVLLSQMTLPGSPLYPVQKLSDSAVIILYPSYRANVMMKRARQVRLLVDKRAGSAAVLTALADYQSAASSYQVDPSNYEAFEYCKDNLEEAAAIAPNPERQAINTTLSSLKDI